MLPNFNNFHTECTLFQQITSNWFSAWHSTKTVTSSWTFLKEKDQFYFWKLQSELHVKGSKYIYNILFFVFICFYYFYYNCVIMKIHYLVFFSSFDMYKIKN